ncbi:MAG TPA: amidohydrolase family protein [Vicinamibacterales bacterium]|nr:amidohydrolase family protein [Vicinamibacterales bacterium]
MRGSLRTSTVVLVALATGAGLVAQQRGGGRGMRSDRGQAVEPGQPCPAGMTLVRPGWCQPPELPPPSILDYRPKSTVVADEHLVPRAKFPVVDIHSHETITAANMAERIAEMDALNLRVLVNLSGGSADRLKQNVETIRSSPHEDRFRVFANVNWSGAGGPGWKEKEVAALEQAIADGAIGLKVFKNLGLSARKADGSRLKVDDPELDPIWQVCAARNVPVLIHVADPAQFFDPLDYRNERWLELALFPNRQYPQDRFPAFEDLMAERDRMFERNPKTRFIAAHFGWHGNDLGRAARLLDRLPNVFYEVGAVLYEFGRQPRGAREFFIRYQDRILFGKDSYQPSEYPYFFRVFETTDEYFDYYRDYHASYKMYGLGLPDAVLKKLYSGNALKVAPGLPQAGWPR